jgi:hypothetical protein
MVYPLPPFAGAPSRGVISASGSGLGRLRDASLERDRVVVDRFAERISREHPDAVTLPARRHTVSSQLLAAWHGLAGLNRLDPKLAAARRATDDERPAAIGIQRNTVDCATADGEQTGYALLLTTTPAEQGGASVTVTGNRFTSPDTLIVAAVSGAGTAAVTGNVVIAGTDERQIALAVLASAAAAITGNVVVGRAVLPPRTLPAPLDTWDAFNEIAF